VKKRVTAVLCLLAATAVGLSAESLSYTGTLSTPEDVFETTFTLTSADTVTFQTWGFGGGTNAAGTVNIGGDNDCGDDFMQVALTAGTYTLVLTDANYIPSAVFDNGALSEGFVDLTDGVFQTCDPAANACISPNGNYAVDIVTAQSDLGTPVPEPSTLPLLCIGLAVLAGAQLLTNRRMSPHE